MRLSLKEGLTVEEEGGAGVWKGDRRGTMGEGEVDRGDILFRE